MLSEIGSGGKSVHLDREVESDIIRPSSIMARPEGEQPEIERTAQQKKPDEKAPTLKARLDATDFSVVLFRPNFMLASEG